jgi:glycosyltransferase involved in cell wall biosynthesis
MPSPAKIKILQIIDSLPREGAEILLFDIVSRCDPVSFSFAVAALTRGGGAAEMISAAGIPVRLLGRRSRWDLPAFLRLRRLVREYRPSIVHTHLFSSRLWGTLAVRLSGVPAAIVHTEHNTSEWKGSRRAAADRVLSLLTDRMVAVSAPVRDSLVSCCRIAAGRITVIENGLNFERMPAAVSRPELMRRLKLPPESLLVGIVAALTPKKGHVYFLEAAARILSRRRDVRFLVLGEGEIRGDLERLAEEKGIGGNVHFLGSRPDAIEIIAAVDVFVLSSIREGLSLALLEAMALARPAVVTSVGGAAGVIESGRTGILVPPRDSPALAEAIDRLLADPDLRRETGERAAAAVRKRFDAGRMIRDYEELYRQLGGRGKKMRNL